MDNYKIHNCKELKNVSINYNDYLIRRRHQVNKRISTN